MIYKPGYKYLIGGTEMIFYYYYNDIPVFEYFIEGKQYLYMEEKVNG